MFKIEVTPSAARIFACSKCDKTTNDSEVQLKIMCDKCDKTTNDSEVQQKVMCDKVKTLKGFCYLGNRLNANEQCEAAVTARTRV